MDAAHEFKTEPEHWDPKDNRRMENKSTKLGLWPTLFGVQLGIFGGEYHHHCISMYINRSDGEKQNL